MARRCDYLLIDVSNSYAKLAFASRERVSNPARIPTSELSRSVVAEFLRRRQVKKLVVSSVVPTKNAAISNAAHNKAQVLWLDWKLKLGVTIDYPKLESINTDRLANAAKHERLREQYPEYRDREKHEGRPVAVDVDANRAVRLDRRCVETTRHVHPHNMTSVAHGMLTGFGL